MTVNVITHHRFFNLDEIAAIALLEIFHFQNYDYNIIRTRDEDTLEKFKNDPNSFVIDVGFDYNPDLLNFDHHQKDMTLSWENGRPYSSCGLIWKWLKDNNKLDLTNNQKMKIEKDFIRKVDEQDNGLSFFKEFDFVNLSNRNHHDDEYIYKQFYKSLRLVKNYLDIIIDNVKQNKKDILNKEPCFNPFLDKLLTHTMMSKYGFDRGFDVIEKENYLRFNTLDKQANPVFIEYDFDNYIFKTNNQKINVTTSMTDFSWVLLKQINKLSMKMNKETQDLMEEKIFNQCKELNKPFNSEEYMNNKDTRFGDLSYVASYQHSNKTYKQKLRAIDNFFSNTFTSIRAEIRETKAIKKYIKNSEKYNGIVFCDSNIKSALNKIYSLSEDKKLVILPRDKSSWKIQNLNNKYGLPSKWRGLTQNKLKNASGNPNLIFCHKSGFMCILKGSKEDVIHFCENLINKNMLEPMNNKNNIQKENIKIRNKKSLKQKNR